MCRSLEGGEDGEVCEGSECAFFISITSTVSTMTTTTTAIIATMWAQAIAASLRTAVRRALRKSGVSSSHWACRKEGAGER